MKLHCAHCISLFLRLYSILMYRITPSMPSIASKTYLSQGWTYRPIPVTNISVLASISRFPTVPFLWSRSPLQRAGIIGFMGHHSQRELGLSSGCWDLDDRWGQVQLKGNFPAKELPLQSSAFTSFSSTPRCAQVSGTAATVCQLPTGCMERKRGQLQTPKLSMWQLNGNLLRGTDKNNGFWEGRGGMQAWAYKGGGILKVERWTLRLFGTGPILLSGPGPGYPLRLYKSQNNTAPAAIYQPHL